MFLLTVNYSTGYPCDPQMIPEKFPIGLVTQDWMTSVFVRFFFWPSCDFKLGTFEVHVAMAIMHVCVCVCVSKTKDRADDMREKSAHSPWRDLNLSLWNTRPSCFRLHHESRHASRQSKQTLQTLTHVCMCGRLHVWFVCDICSNFSVFVCYFGSSRTCAGLSSTPFRRHRKVHPGRCMAQLDFTQCRGEGIKSATVWDRSAFSFYHHTEIVFDVLDWFRWFHQMPVTHAVSFNLASVLDRHSYLLQRRNNNKKKKRQEEKHRFLYSKMNALSSAAGVVFTPCSVNSESAVL